LKNLSAKKKICKNYEYLAAIFEKDSKRRQDDSKKDVYACSRTVTRHFCSLGFLNSQTFLCEVAAYEKYKGTIVIRTKHRKPLTAEFVT